MSLLYKKFSPCLISLLLIAVSTTANATIIKGIVTDQKTKESLIGATVIVKGSNKGASVSLSGTFKLLISAPGQYTLVCSFIGYKSYDKIVSVGNEENLQVDFELEENANELNEIVISGQQDKTSDEYALHSEKTSESIVNIMSAKTIQLMPDITVANLLQRFSGVSVERNSSGDAQYAIIRGMPQRYNYTLVNGIKIPSPDPKNRYVPMDIFPADLLDRLEVIKSLTPAMEGDATGGAMNLVMKDAPATFTVNAGAAMGTNTIAMDRGFSTFSGWQQKAPVQTHGADYVATPSDFSYRNFKYYNTSPVNQVYNFSIGDRLTKDKRLGLIFAGSYQSLFRSTNSTFFKPENQPNPDNQPTFDDIYIRKYSNHQTRYGLHAKADYRLNQKTTLKLYAMYVGLNEVQRRHTIDTSLSIGRTGFGTGATYLLDRSRVQQQNIFNVMLQGDHRVTEELRANWSAVYSKASNSVPDWSESQTSQYVINGIVADAQSLYTLDRIWTNNSDRDYTGYLNLIYDKDLGNHGFEFSAGGLYRDKTRNTNYYYYHLVPSKIDERFQNGVNTLAADQWQFEGTDAAQGNAVNPNTYIAHEQIASGYVQGKALLSDKLEILGGVRAEHTFQSYMTPMPATFAGANGSKSYLDILPSLHFKYKLTPNDNLRASYFKSINRASLFEIVPSQMPGDYFPEAGNPYLNHATIQNLDLRYEKFTKTLDQISAGVFYKHIVNPIETIWHKDSTSTSGSVIGPANLGSARNFGFEVAVTKYWGRFGLTGNYTYTNSRITTTKLYTTSNQIIVVSQTRPLQGQSPHIANLSFLYKDVDHGLSLQLAASYTSSRISLVSPYQNLDYWQQPLFMMDFSLEKSFLQHFSFYLKVQNLLNTPYQVYIHHSNIYTSGVNQLPDQTDKNRILVQREYYGQNFIAGVRYKFSK